MSKKDFKNNPALQFISDDQSQSQSDTQTESKPKRTTYKKKEDDLEQRLAELRELLPEGKSLTIKSEPRSKRLQLVLTPTLSRKLKEAAERQEISINEYVNRLIEASVESED